MTSKIFAGVAFLAPVYAATVMYRRIGEEEEEESWKDTMKTTSKRWFNCGIALFAGGIALIGVGHIVSGGYDLSPQLCPRDMGDVNIE